MFFFRGKKISKLFNGAPSKLLGLFKRVFRTVVTSYSWRNCNKEFVHGCARFAPWFGQWAGANRALFSFYVIYSYIRYICDIQLNLECFNILYLFYNVNILWNFCYSMRTICPGWQMNPGANCAHIRSAVTPDFKVLSCSDVELTKLLFILTIF